MAKITYIGNGNSKKVSKIYLGSGNISHKIKKGYIGDASGKARLFYTSGYQWQRYSINYIEQFSTDDNENSAPFRTYLSNETDVYVMYATSIKFITSGTPSYAPPDSKIDIVNPTSHRIYGNPDTTLSLRTYQSPTGVYYIVYSGRWMGFELGYLKGVYKLGPDSSQFDIWAKNGDPGLVVYGGTASAYGGVVLHKVYAAPTQGSYIGIVESDNPAAYPNNGVSGDYWYVRIS